MQESFLKYEQIVHLCDPMILLFLLFQAKISKFHSHAYLYKKKEETRQVTFLHDYCFAITHQINLKQNKNLNFYILLLSALISALLFHKKHKVILNIFCSFQ